MIIDGVRAEVEHASGCSCEPTEDDARGVLEVQAKIYCLHCTRPMDPDTLRLMCFCVAGGTGSGSGINWAGNIQEYKAAVTVVIEGHRHLLHEPCSRKILPGLYS